MCCVAQSSSTLCDTMDCSLQAPMSMGVLQARILEWVAMPSSRGSSQPRDRTQVSHIAGRFFTIWATREAPPPPLFVFFIDILNQVGEVLLVLNFLINEGWPFKTFSCILWDFCFNLLMIKWNVLVAQSCPTVCDPMDNSLPGFSVHGIFQVRILDGLPILSPGDLLRGIFPTQRLNLIGNDTLSFLYTQMSSIH